MGDGRLLTLLRRGMFLENSPRQERLPFDLSSSKTISVDPHRLGKLTRKTLGEYEQTRISLGEQDFCGWFISLKL
jgi:hypothetical protein